MKTQFIVIAAILLAGIGGGAFYVGMQYEKNTMAKAAPVTTRSFSGNRSVGAEGGQRTEQNGGSMRRGDSNGNGNVFGEILSKDDGSLTVKMPDGGSTIVYFTDALQVRKTEVGSLTDLAIGQQIMVNGKRNAEGSLAAEGVSIMPQR